MQSNYFDHIYDSLVDETYHNNENYKIVNGAADNLFIYFSSNGIYYPNSRNNFYKSLIIDDKYEWFNIDKMILKKHASLFVRDIRKQWYVKGINSSISSIDSMIAFFMDYKNKYTSTIMVGSSAGAFASMLIGSIIGVNAVFSFAGQFNIQTDSMELKNMALREMYIECYKYYDVCSYIEHSNVPIFYFVCAHSELDKQQIEFAKNTKNVYVFLIDCNIHGLSLNAFILPRLLKTSPIKLIRLSIELNNQIISSKEFGKIVCGKWLYFYIAFFTISRLGKLYAKKFKELVTKVFLCK